MAIIKCSVCFQEHEEGLRHDRNGKLEPPTMKAGFHFRYGGCGEIDEHNAYGETIYRD
jgi:hypothetical protein